jgi:hypothetical protein
MKNNTIPSKRCNLSRKNEDNIKIYRDFIQFCIANFLTMCYAERQRTAAGTGGANEFGGFDLWLIASF